MRGFPMGGGNMNNMMKQVQKLQKQMEKMQEQMQSNEYTASVGGGAVEAVVNGNKEVLKIKIDKDVVDPDDVEMLEDLVMSAVNEAMRTAENQMSTEMKKLTGGLNIPGM